MSNSSEGYRLLKGISIRNFRGIRESKIDGFNQINVFIGEFGSGKSTILDAIYLLRINADLRRVLSRRTGRGIDLRSCWYKFAKEKEIEIDYTLDSYLYKILLKVSPEDPNQVQLFRRADDTATQRSTGHNMYLSWDASEIRREIGTIEIPSKEQFFPRRLTLLDAEMFRNVLDSESNILTPIREEKLDKEFLSILKDVFDTLEGFEFLRFTERLPRESRCFVSLKDAAVPIDDVSDGIRNGLIILSTAFVLKETALLLEEPENHMYPKALDRLLQKLVDLCKSNQLQLFVTTHRPEVLATLVEHGKELTTVFHFSRKNGAVRARPAPWNDTKILSEIGWDIGKLVKGYEKFVVVEGLRDKLMLDQCFRTLKKAFPENIWVAILPCRGKDNLVEVVKAILPTEREIFLLPDLNKKTSDDRIKQLVDSLTTMRSEGYEISEKDGVMTFSKGATKATLKLKNILPLGDRKGLEDLGLKFESFSMDDYLLEILLQNPNTWSSLEISEENIERSKQFTESKSAISLMRLNDEKVEKLLQECPLPKGLPEIIEAIVGKD